MDESRRVEEMPLEEFVAQPDTIPLLSRDGYLGDEEFRWTHGIRVGEHLAADYYIHYARRRDIDDIMAEAGATALTMLPVVMGLMEAKDLDAAGITQVQRNPLLDLKGRGVLLGFVDTGIDYTSEAFLYEDGSSKIRAIWDQTGTGGAPEGFYFGAEYSGEQINGALGAENPYDTVPQRDTAGHGTFLASVAAGREEGQYIGAAPEAEIIAVKLRGANAYYREQQLIPPDQENAYLSSDMMLGVQYIVDKAAELDRPVAICIALGTNLGGHDGHSLMEEYFTRISNTEGVALVCAAGNESQAGHHASGRFTAEGEAHDIELLAGARGDDILINMWTAASDRTAVSITSPTGEVVPRVQVRSGTSYTTSLVVERSRVTIEYFLPVRGSGDQLTIIKIINPTPGIWTITVHSEIVLDGRYHLWLPVTGLIDPETSFLTPNPNYTVVLPATSTGVITCGAYNALNNALYVNSSWGNTRLPMVSPDLAAPGVNVGGTYPAGHGQMSGTSVSAAITAGAAALMLQWGIVDGNDTALTTIRIRSNMIRGCERDASMEYPNPQWGYGRLNLYDALTAIRP